jgi:cyclic pyranopterin phosphate synthase
MPEEGAVFSNRADILTYEEIERFVRAAVPLGINKLRLTGGEPLVRRDLASLVARLAVIPGIIDLALTTNAVLLEQYAESLYKAGLRRLNIHLDTLDREKFQRITRRDDLPRVMAGIDAAVRAGFERIKLNIVAVKGLMEPDIVPIARFCRERGFEPRYIEFMPLDAQSLWERQRVLSADQMIAMLSEEFGPLEPVPDADPRAPATEYRYTDGAPGSAPGSERRVGFIASVTRPFCLNCNRIRITSDGKLRYCLFAIEETDVRGLLRSGASDEEIASVIRRNVAEKWLGHEINSTKFIPPPRPMYSIGG